MRVLQIGNFAAPHSTENHLARALRVQGHRVTIMQENDPASWRRLAERGVDADVLLWTRTAWDWRRLGEDPALVREIQWAVLARCRADGVPTLGFHLDRWWGLAREYEVGIEPFFAVDVLATADGGHEELWRQAGVRHVWLPPGVSQAECRPGTYRRHLASDVAFVGSWQGRYHPEWPHREELVSWLCEMYGPRVRFWPQPGRPALRGQALRDLYASVKVLVGDSCLVGGAVRYCSDRIPETLGRGGYLLHPHVDGVTDGSLYIPGAHLATWPLGDWAALREQIDRALADEPMRRAVTRAGREHVLARHTYERRVPELLALLPVRVA